MGKVRSSSVTVKVRSEGHVKVTVEVHQRQLLKFGQGNAKLPPWVTTFSLPAGHTCPFAQDCRSSADRSTGRITDGPHTEFRCYKASEEARYKTSRESGWHNFDLLRKCESKAAMAELILDSLLPGTPVVRVHTGGDFFNQPYLDAWLTVAERRPRTVFYFYTKSLRYWVSRLDEVGDGHTAGSVPNFIPTASRGSREDHFIDQYGLRSARVVLSEREAAVLGLPIDHDDSHAMSNGGDFALLIHGTQPAGTEAARAIATLRALGEYGYGAKSEATRINNRRLPLVTVS